jgi:hypothetical protein
LIGDARFEKDGAGRRSLLFPGRSATVILPRPKGQQMLALVIDRPTAKTLTRWTFFVNDTQAEAEARACPQPHADLYHLRLPGPPSYLARTTVLFRCEEVPLETAPGLRLYALQFFS